MQVAKPETWDLLDFTSITKDDKTKKDKIKTSGYLEKGKYPIIDQGQDLVAGYTNDSSLIYKGELPVIVFGDHTLVVKFIDCPFAIGADGTKIIQSNQEKCIPKFLYYAINAKNIQSEGYKRHFSKLREQTFLIPPLPEQKQITIILSNVDDTLQKTNQIIEQTQRLKKGMMQKLLTRGIGHTKFKKTKIGEIPEEWDVKTVKETSNETKNAVLTGPFGSLLHSSDYTIQGTPLILVKNIVRGKINDSDIPKISQKDVERLSKYVVKEGDMIFSRVGRVGSCAVIEKKHEGWLFSGQTLRIRLSNQKINNYFLNYFIQSRMFLKRLENDVVGSTRDSINTSILEKLLIVIPPLPEQKQIVSILSNVDTQIQKEKLHKSNLERLKKGLMQKLLTGQIRVKVR